MDGLEKADEQIHVCIAALANAIREYFLVQQDYSRRIPGAALESLKHEIQEGPPLEEIYVSLRWPLNGGGMYVDLLTGKLYSARQEADDISVIALLASYKSYNAQSIYESMLKECEGPYRPGFEPESEEDGSFESID